jgi:hypothetical protein
MVDGRVPVAPLTRECRIISVYADGNTLVVTDGGGRAVGVLDLRIHSHVAVASFELAQ